MTSCAFKDFNAWRGGKDQRIITYILYIASITLKIKFSTHPHHIPNSFEFYYYLLDTK